MFTQSTYSGSSLTSQPDRLVSQYMQVAVSSPGVVSGVNTKPALAIYVAHIRTQIQFNHKRRKEVRTLVALQPCSADWCGHHCSVFPPKVSNRAFSNAFEDGILVLVRNSKLNQNVMRAPDYLVKDEHLLPLFILLEFQCASN